MNNSKPNVDWALFKIDQIFKVLDISNDLKTAKDSEEAKEIHNDYDYNRVPIRKNGVINEYYDTNTNAVVKIESNEIVESSLGILEIFSYLSKRDFYFVLTGNEITRIVHYSDLNYPLVLIGLYTQITYCEKAIRDFARSKANKNTESEIENFLNGINNNITGKKIDINRAKRQFRQKKQTQIETDLFDELYFDDELILFRELYQGTLTGCRLEKFKEIINLEDEVINSDNALRNDIMHSKPEIIKQKDDTKKWLTFLQRCQNIINTINGKVDIQC
ncbi:MAG: hypothetical protein ACYDAO_00045 [Thermoplasmataceae archaeon]